MVSLILYHSKIQDLNNSHTYFLSDEAANTIPLPIPNKVHIYIF